MAQRMTFVELAGMGVAPSRFARRTPQPEEPRPIPLCACDLEGDFGQALVDPTLIGKAALNHYDAIGMRAPGSDKFRTGLDPPRQFKPAIWFGSGSLYQLVEQTLVLS